MALSTSLRPAPTRPPSPRISPLRKEKLMSSTMFCPLLEGCGTVRCSTRSTSPPISAGCLGYMFWIGRPIIASTKASSVISPIGSVRTTAPSRITVTRSAMRKISSSLCDMKIMETPSRRRLSIVDISMSVSLSVRALVGSSSTMMRGDLLSARAMEIICIWPLLQPRTKRRGSRSRPTFFSIRELSSYSFLKSTRPCLIGRLPT